MDIRNRMTKLEEIQDILETCPLDKVTTQTLYDVIMEVIERDEIDPTNESIDPWLFTRYSTNK